MRLGGTLGIKGNKSVNMGGNFDGKCVPEERVECKPKHTKLSLLHVRASIHDKLIVRSARLDLIRSNSF